MYFIEYESIIYKAFFIKVQVVPFFGYGFKCKQVFC